MVALLAARWPEAELRKQLEALGLAGQPLSQWALSHAAKARPLPTERAAAALHRCLSSGSPATPVAPRDAARSSSSHRLPSQQAEVKFLREPQVSPKVEAPPTETAKQERPGGATLHRVASASAATEAAEQVSASSQGRPGAAADAARCSLAQPKQTQGNALQGSSCPLLADSNARARACQSSVAERRVENKAQLTLTGGGREAVKPSLSRSPSAATVARVQPRVQSATPRKAKLPDAAAYLPSKANRNPLLSLPLGKLNSYGPQLKTPSGENSHAARPYCALSRKYQQEDGHPLKKEASSAANPASARKGSVRKTRLLKEQATTNRETQGHTSRPPSAFASSRGTVKQPKVTLLPSNPPLLTSVRANLRATQPLLPTLQDSSLPSRRTCGAVLSIGREGSSKGGFSKEQGEDVFGSQVLRDMSQLALPVLTAGNAAEGPLPLKKKLPPLPPTVRLPSAVFADEAGQHSDSSADSASTMASPETSIKAQQQPNPKRLAASSTAAAPTGLPAALGPQTAQKFENCKLADRKDKWDTNNELSEEPATRPPAAFCPETPEHMHKAEQRENNPPGFCLPTRSVRALEHRASQDSAALAQVKGHLQRGGDAVLRQAKPTLVHAPAIYRALDPSKHPVNSEVKAARSAAEMSESAMWLQHPSGKALDRSNEWPPRQCYAAPERSSLPAGYDMRLQASAADGAVRQQHAAFMVVGGPPAMMPWGPRPVPQRQTFMPSDANSFAMQQGYMMQQHTLRQQQLMFQAQTAQRAFQLQQQMGAGNLQFFLNGAGGPPAFVAGQRQTTWNPLHSASVGR